MGECLSLDEINYLNLVSKQVARENMHSVCGKTLLLATIRTEVIFRVKFITT